MQFIQVSLHSILSDFERPINLVHHKEGVVLSLDHLCPQDFRSSRIAIMASYSATLLVNFIVLIDCLTILPISGFNTMPSPDPFAFEAPFIKRVQIPEEVSEFNNNSLSTSSIRADVKSATKSTKI